MKQILMCATLAFVLSGCGILMPYHEDFACRKGEGEGYCGSVKENYQRIAGGSSNSNLVFGNDETHLDREFIEALYLEANR